MVKELSGVQWVERFPDFGQVSDLNGSFRTDCEAFVAALAAARATVTISSTLRPKERAYLMYGCWRISRRTINPQNLQPLPGVEIDWVHRNGSGGIDLVASRAAARAMADRYGLAYAPALNSNHTRGLAIDMTIGWRGSLKIVNAKGALVTIASSPRSGMNQDLWRVGRSYKVVKHRSDRPHWSINGR